MTLYQMFNAIAPSLIIECSTADVATLLALRVREGKKKISHNWPLPSNIVQSWLADLASFDLVEESKKQHAVSDKEEYWKLTKKGQALYLHLRRARLEVGLEESPVPDATSEIVPEKPSTRGKN